MTDEVQRAWELVCLRRPKEAAAAALRHLEQDPGSVRALTVLGRAQHSLGRSADAMATLARALAASPDQAYAHYVLAWVRYELGAIAEAEAGARRALDLDPRLASVHELLACIAQHRGAYDDALHGFDRALELEPRNAGFHFARARLLRIMGKPEDAFLAASAGLACDPEHARLLLMHGQLSLARGDVGNAVDSFSAALRADPANEETRAALLTALRARSPFYRAALRWLPRLGPPDRRLCLFICACGLPALVADVLGAKRYEPVLFSIVVLVLLPAHVTNVLLLSHPLGRRLLDRASRIVSPIVCTTALAAAVLSSWAWWIDSPPLHRQSIEIIELTFLFAFFHFLFSAAKAEKQPAKR